MLQQNEWAAKTQSGKSMTTGVTFMSRPEFFSQPAAFWSKGTGIFITRTKRLQCESEQNLHLATCRMSGNLSLRLPYDCMACCLWKGASPPFRQNCLLLILTQSMNTLRGAVNLYRGTRTYLEGGSLYTVAMTLKQRRSLIEHVMQSKNVFLNTALLMLLVTECRRMHCACVMRLF